VQLAPKVVCALALQDEVTKIFTKPFLGYTDSMIVASWASDFAVVVVSRLYNLLQLNAGHIAVIFAVPTAFYPALRFDVRFEIGQEPFADHKPSD